MGQRKLGRPVAAVEFGAEGHRGQVRGSEQRGCLMASPPEGLTAGPCCRLVS